MGVVIIILVIVVLVIVAIIAGYNALISLNERVNEAWSDITVQLKYRADLIPNLVETVKGYAKHESETFDAVTKARTAVAGAKTVAETAAAEKTMEAALSKVIAVAESYPELKASENFKTLQGQLQDTEDKIQAARRFYNNGVKELNTKIKTFPSNVINNGFAHLKEREYFEVEENERKNIEKAPEVKF